MAKPYRTLRAQLTPAAQAQAEEKARALLAALEETDDTAQDQACAQAQTQDDDAHTRFPPGSHPVQGVEG